MDVAVTGSSGLIGTALAPALEAAGHRMIRMVRSEPSGQDSLHWDPGVGTIEAAGLEGVAAVVHLAGVGIGERHWSKSQKFAIHDSRVRGTAFLAETLAKLQRPPAVLVSASAIGYYGDRGDEILTEDSRPGTGFLAEVCQAWEGATAPAEAAGIRVVHLRTGIVITKEGGALVKMIPPFKIFFGGRMGSGKQWMSWITLDDEVGAIVHLLKDGAPAGPVNVTSPHPVTNAGFTAVLGKALHRPAIFHIPKFAIRLGLGREMADELILSGQRVMPTRLLESGYEYQWPKIMEAMKEVVSRPLSEAAKERQKKGRRRRKAKS